MEEMKTVNISNEPELPQPVEEIRATREPHLLRRNSEDVAILTPITARKRAPSKPAPVTRDDALFRLIGIGESDVPAGFLARNRSIRQKPTASANL